VTEDIRNRQEHIQFLENYIVELTTQIEELTDGRDIPKRIRSLEYRIETLGKSDGEFNGRVKEFQIELKSLQDEFSKLFPILEKLEKERAFYRSLQSEL